MSLTSKREILKQMFLLHICTFEILKSICKGCELALTAPWVVFSKYTVEINPFYAQLTSTPESTNAKNSFEKSSLIKSFTLT